ncbi:MAG: glycosyltransferase, partial [Burkholderiaceae bacterium]
MTIAIPAHNEEAYLGSCLDAVIAEIDRDRSTPGRGGDDASIEILVIDNASSDGTAAVAESRVAAAHAAGAVL